MTCYRGSRLDSFFGGSASDVPWMDLFGISMLRGWSVGDSFELGGEGLGALMGLFVIDLGCIWVVST